MRSKFLALVIQILLVIGVPTFSLSQNNPQSEQEKRRQQEAHRKQEEQVRRAQEAQRKAQQGAQLRAQQEQQRRVQQEQERVRREAYRKQQEERRRAEDARKIAEAQKRWAQGERRQPQDIEWPNQQWRSKGIKIKNEGGGKVQQERSKKPPQIEQKTQKTQAATASKEISISKIPENIANTRKATTGYLKEKIGPDPAKSKIYKTTEWMEKPGIQKIVKGSEKVVGEIEKAAPAVSNLGTVSREVKGRQIDKIPMAVKEARKSTTEYFTEKMGPDPSKSQWYGKTEWMDKPGVQRVLKVNEKILNEVDRAAPAAKSLGSIARSMKLKQVDKVPADIKQARAATTEYLTEKMGNDPGKSKLYKATDWVDRPGMKKVLQANEKVLGEVEKAAPAVTSLGSLARSLRDPNRWDKVQKATAEARKQTTDYFAGQMGDDPSKSKWYQSTNWMDKPGAQKPLQRIEKGLDILEKDKLIGGGLSATAHIRRMELSKLQEDFGNLRRGASEDLKAVGDKGGDFLVKRMGPDPMESRLYKSTEWMDNPTLRRGTQFAERGLDRIEKSRMLKTGLEYTEKGINLVKKAKDVKETVITAGKKLQDIEKGVGGALEKGKEKIRGWWERVTD